MKTNNNEDVSYNDADLTNDLPLFSITPDEREEDDEDNDDEAGDWGEVDPAGGDEPSAPGSAV